MCWFCDHPGGTLRDYLDFLRDKITTYGWAVQGVPRDRIHRGHWPWDVGYRGVRGGQPVLGVRASARRDVA